jgi:hypothetical protein
MRLTTSEFHQQPPPDGLRAALRRGRSLRRRRRTLAGGAACTVASVVFGLTLVTSGGSSSSLEQIPADHGTATPTPSPFPAGLPHLNLGLRGPAATASPGTGRSSSVLVSAGTPGNRVGSYLRPWHRAVTRRVTSTDYAGTCPFGGLSSPAAVNGWCVAGYKSGDVKGSLVAFIGAEVCRDLTTFNDRSLSFSHNQELEVVISRNGRELWRWSASQVATGKPHVVVIHQRNCVQWRTTWNGTTSDGQKLPNATYDVTATVISASQAGLVGRTTARILS